MTEADVTEAIKHLRRRSKVNSKEFLVRLPPEMYKTVKLMAAADDLSMAQLIRRAIREYIAARAVEATKESERHGYPASHEI